ncbi:MAG TPA: DEAD/DEAH box helicase [Candidatus Dormibacteraeota bacterium]|nr:DEAD/DEAH box helicase [Candidatus Dormibacteraeota bacterium]
MPSRRPHSRASSVDPLSAFGPATQDWFRAAFGAPTPAQARGWPAIAAGEHTLICAPTGSGKTLAAFLWCLDRLAAETEPSEPGRALRVLYVSPLKALVHDVERNLRSPLQGLALAAQARGEPAPRISVAMRTGDTPAEERRRFGAHPPDILVTTPESLYLLLTSQAREALRTVRWLIVDEIHALAGTKRGAHLALSLERLEALAERPPQRIGLSATQRPLETVAAYLGGRTQGGEAGSPAPGPPRAVTIVDAGVRKALELQVVVPVEDMGRLGEPIPLDEAPGGPAAGPEARTSIWPAIHPRLLELIRAHRSTIVFVNSRRLAERLAQRLNELAGEELVRAHHGSLSREQRLAIEEALKSGRLPALIATSSLELGIDMGAVDLVVQVESPLSVARGLQRIGRAGHQVDEPSRGVIFPKYRGDLLEVAVVTKAMHEGAIESTVLPRNPLDVLAQQLVATAADRAWPVDELYGLVRRAENFAELGRDAFEATLGMLAGQYPADEFAELRPRLVWDRVAGTVHSRRDARTVALTSGGTIPDRGYFGVFLEADGDGAPTRARSGREAGGRRVGELDEEMVYEARAGEVILLGASAWRIERITHDRVLVSPAPGEPGKIPFWKGDGVGRPVELGRALGAFTRRMGEAAGGTERAREAAMGVLAREHDLDPLAARNLLDYLAEEQGATGALPTDRTIVLQRFRDELGDWRICLLSPFGARVHAPWALAIEARLREQLGLEIQPLWSDDGIVLRLPATDEGGASLDALAGQIGAADSGDPGAASEALQPGEAPGPLDLSGRSGAMAAEAAVRIAADDVEELVVGVLGGSALFASRFRENAARALLLPRRHPGARQPLWQSRQRAAQLLGVASRYGSFPIILETYRECLQDVFDLPALREILAGLERRDIRLVSVELQRASPFASSLLFDYIAAYMYEGDAPLADRRAQALALDRDLLRELLGADELRELLDPAALADLELELQCLTEERAAGSVDQVHDLLRRLGDLTDGEVAARVRGADTRARERAAGEWLEALAADRRAIRIRIAGERRWIAAEEAARYRDAVGAALPVGLPEAFLAPGRDPLAALLARYARRHGPFLSEGPARRWGLPVGAVEPVLDGLLAGGTILRGEFRPGGSEREWCDPEVLRSLRRRSLARLRREVEPVEPAALARFLPAWQGVGGAPGGLDRLAEVVAQLEGLALPASVLERDVLPARVRGYVPRLLDELGAAGEVLWVGQGSLGRDDGRVALYRPDRLALLLPAGTTADAPAEGWLHETLREHLARRGASFYRDLLAAAAVAARARDTRSPTQRELLDALWDLVWAGLVTNDTFAPLRALRWKRTAREPARPRPGSAGRLGPPEASGRWSLVADALATAVALAGREPTATDRGHALAMRLLERQGVVTRESVAGEGVAGGFGAVYPVLRELEEHGRVRRGYFVEGLGGAQFALPGAVDRMRAGRVESGTSGQEAPVAQVLAATDPANPYGAALAWPAYGTADSRTPTRAAGAYVVSCGGEAVLYLERGGRSLQTFPAAALPAVGEAALAALVTLVADGRLRGIELRHVDGQRIEGSAWQDRLTAAGFRPGYRGWALRPATR